MTLLDYFAAHASDDDLDAIAPGITPGERGRAWARYEHAETMLAERKRREAGT
jgi:hypothetical protein